MTTANLQIGDYVRDPLDGTLRKIIRIDGDTIHMADGGFMARSECTDVLLPSEVE